MRTCEIESCCWYHKGTNFQANHNGYVPTYSKYKVVVDTTKVRIFKQITTLVLILIFANQLLLIPQRYEFSSKSQLSAGVGEISSRCCWYHKGTNFQANHNINLPYEQYKLVVVDTTKVRIFKQITTKVLRPMQQALLLLIPQRYEFSSKSQQYNDTCHELFSCCWYHKGTNFQANHNTNFRLNMMLPVVVDTTKVRIFKQITTNCWYTYNTDLLLLIPQRYEFSSKSQRLFESASWLKCCCWYHKGTNFQANHNYIYAILWCIWVVVDTTKVRIFKQITTYNNTYNHQHKLLLIPQRYEFSSKSQHKVDAYPFPNSCCWYHKGTNFQANHNSNIIRICPHLVVVDTTKVRIFKQITTGSH